MVTDKQRALLFIDIFLRLTVGPTEPADALLEYNRRRASDDWSDAAIASSYALDVAAALRADVLGRRLRSIPYSLLETPADRIMRLSHPPKEWGFYPSQREEGERLKRRAIPSFTSEAEGQIKIPDLNSTPLAPGRPVQAVNSAENSSAPSGGILRPAFP